ncbi:MAG: hypothetical protein JST02_06695 [Bacteroidetes bacterium]|nr:hypothetical protein [Bacteroidota bacterium]
MKRNFRILLSYIVGIFISYRLISTANHEDLFASLGNIFYGIIWLVTILIVLFFDNKEFKETKKWLSFLATFISIIIFTGYLFIFNNIKYNDKAPSLIYCVTKISDFNGISIDFRKDGTYKLTSWGLGAEIYRGKFTIKDSIITVDKSQIENNIISSRFVIRQDGDIDSIGRQEKSIYQIDQQGKVINQSADFRVIENWKNK